MTDESHAEATAARMRDAIRQAVATKGRRATKKEWAAPTLEDFAFGTVLSFDQTVGKTGFSVVRHDFEGLWVLDGNVLVPTISNDLKGFEQTLARSAVMHKAIGYVVMLLGGSVEAIVHEMPAVQGYRTESSLLAAHSVRIAALDHARGIPVHMVNNQAMRALLNAPEERYEKKFVKKAVETLIPRERRAAKRWSQDVHDSVGLALTHLHQKKART